MMAKIRFTDLITILGIFFLAFFYMIFRFNDLSPLSDEVYYFTEDLAVGERRWIFTNFVQLFGTFEDALLAVSLINIFLLIPIYYFLLRINENNSLITFFQMIYITTLASYVLRDIWVLFLTLWAITLILDFSKSKYKPLNLLTIVMLFFILSVSKLQYIFFLFTAMFVAFMALRAPKTLVFLVIIFVIFSLFSNNLGSYLNKVPIYAITLLEFIDLRSERYGYDLSSDGLGYVFLRHIFAPIPFSLLDRFIYPDINHPLVTIDDLYRFTYRMGLYFFIFYVLFNSRIALEYIKNNRFLIFLILSMSILNIITYSIFTGGGGHERNKIMSALILFALSSGIISYKKLNAKF